DVACVEPAGVAGEVGLPRARVRTAHVGVRRGSCRAARRDRRVGTGGVDPNRIGSPTAPDDRATHHPPLQCPAGPARRNAHQGPGPTPGSEERPMTTIRSAYPTRHVVNRRLRDAVAQLTDAQLATRPGPDRWPMWATIGHLACQRVFWQCDF